MSWHFQATHKCVDEEHCYEVREVYHDIEGEGSLMWTENAIAPFSETKEGLIEVLKMMLSDVEHYDVLELDC